MSTSGEIEISLGPRRTPSWATYGKDFANILKAFIGSNYLTISFAFCKSGLAFGLLGVVLIASLTAHCCNLIVKCKHHVVHQILQDLKNKCNTQQGENRSYGTKNPSTSSSEGSEESTIEDGDSDTNKNLLRTLSYGDVGRFCFGRLGLAMVNVPVIITQFGFCIGYCIFIGNTIQSMFPMYNCSMPATNSSVPSLVDNPALCMQVKAVNSVMMVPVGMANLTETIPGVLHSVRNLPLYSPIEQSMSSISDDILLWLLNNATTALAPNTTMAPNTTTSMAPYTTTTLAPDTTSSVPIENTTVSIPWSNITIWTLTRGDHVPDLKYLVLMPVPIFMLTTLIRSLRRMGFISLLANAAILVGCGEVLYFLISGFEVSDGFRWINWMGIPVFFGLVTSSFEGIGTIVPIEGSMEGNRHNFTKYLYGAVSILATILISFGTLGYVHFGDGIEQMVNANIPSGDSLNIFVNVSLCIGVLLTFPLMMFPVVDLAEKFIFGTGCCCCPEDEEEEEEQETQELMPNSEVEDASARNSGIPEDVPWWKRTALRIVIVLCAAAFAVLLRNYFAYISAFVGALGSTILAFILPCLFHLKLCWNHLPLSIKIKDISVIVFGISLGMAGVYSVLSEIISG